MSNLKAVKEKIEKASVVGAGGAGFPAHIKISENIDTILINGVECEPLLKTDFYLIKTYKKELFEALNFLCSELNIKSGVIAIKKHTAELLNIKDNESDNRASFKIVGDIYPAGDEIILIKEALGKAVPPGNLPLSVSVVVFNVETLLNIKNAVTYDKPVTEKFFTVGGNTEKTYVVKADIGTKVDYVFKKLGIKVPDNCVVLDGGPMMGKIINHNTAEITKTTKGLLIIEKNTLCIKQKLTNLGTALNRASGSCCGCRMCTDMCPRYLMGYPIEPHKILSAFPKNGVTKTHKGAFYCSNCGVCETIACPQNISPNKLFAKTKSELIKDGIKLDKYDAAAPKGVREYRKIPVSRVIDRLGIRKYYREEFTYIEVK